REGRRAEALQSFAGTFVGGKVAETQYARARGFGHRVTRGREAPDARPGEEDEIIARMPDPVQSPIRTLLLVLGGVIFALGLLWPTVSRYFGRLPGDVVVRRENWTFAFPIVTCLVLSLLLSLLLWFFRR